ncbi:MAG: paraquat-inducible protein A [Methyloprofundus sp.]|nr:paraquat-inducible protein A [Methyloprofundus sp.]
MKSALKQGYLSCRHCHKLIVNSHAEVHTCPRCNSKIHPRIPQSLRMSWALLLTGFFLYIPANVLPIMTLKKMWVLRTDTIMSGIINLYNIDMAPIAAIVFIASVFVPLLKMVALAYILLAIQFKWQKGVLLRSKMYRMVEFIGRWSMLDIFVISILLAIVKFGNVASVNLEPAALLFELVVILTMLAALCLDSRLIWDSGNDSY